MVHYLKTLPDDFNATTGGIKPFEVRKNDRDYTPGDFLILREFDAEQYTGRKMIVKVTYVLKGGNLGIDPDYVVMGCKVPDIMEINNDLPTQTINQFEIDYPPNED